MVVTGVEEGGLQVVVQGPHDQDPVRLEGVQADGGRVGLNLPGEEGLAELEAQEHRAPVQDTPRAEGRRGQEPRDRDGLRRPRRPSRSEATPGHPAQD